MLLKGPILRAILHFPTVVGASVDTSLAPTLRCRFRQVFVYKVFRDRRDVTRDIFRLM